jgi:hypothetical protein
MPNAEAAWASQAFEDWNAMSDAGIESRSTAS